MATAGNQGVRDACVWTNYLCMYYLKRCDANEVIVGEVANFAAYAFAPAVLVTPLGALSIIVSPILAHFILRERLQMFGILGSLLYVVGSVTIALHAPQEKEIESVKEVWHLATEPGFIIYFLVVIGLDVFLIFKLAPKYGHSHMFVYIGICSLTGSLTVMGVKALTIALKLSFSGMNQFIYIQTWAFALVVSSCVVLQMNYLNKVKPGSVFDNILICDNPEYARQIVLETWA